MKRLLAASSIVIATVWLITYSIRAQEKPTGLATTNSQAPGTVELWRQVEIIRTAHGVPHIRAENLRAAGYALAWLQSEDYGPRTALNVLAARGQLATITGSRENIDSDFLAQALRTRAIQTYHLLDQETRDV